MVQNTTGATIAHMPTTATTHCSQRQRRTMPSIANPAIKRPDRISLTPRRMLRIAGSATSWPSAGGTGAAAGSKRPSIIGDATSQSPSAAFVIGAQSVQARWRSIAASASSSLRSSGPSSRRAACSISGPEAATTAGSSLFVVYQSVGSALSRLIISGRVPVRLCRGSQPSRDRAREISIS